MGKRNDSMKSALGLYRWCYYYTMSQKRPAFDLL